MSFVKTLVEYEKKRREMESKNVNDRHFAYCVLSGLDRYRFERINRMISKITTDIRQNTGWEYSNHSFTTRSNFRLEGGDIVFDVNTVSSKNGLYISDESTNDRELAFLSDNAKLLKRLGKLETKYDSYIEKARREHPNVILSEEVQTKSDIRKKNLDDLFLLGWMEEEAKQFLINNGSKNVIRLVNMLNIIADNTLEEGYKKINGFSLSSSLKKELLRWCSAYSYSGTILFDRFNDDRRKVEEYDRFPDSFMHDESDIIMYYKNRH